MNLKVVLDELSSSTGADLLMKGYRIDSPAAVPTRNIPGARSIGSVIRFKIVMIKMKLKLTSMVLALLLCL